MTLAFFNIPSFEITWTWWAPPTFVAVIFAALVGFIIWLYHIDGRRLSNAQRRFLLVWRCLAVICVLLMLAEPKFRQTSREERPAVVAIVVDESESMGLPDAPDNPLIPFYDPKATRDEKSRYAVAKKVTEELLNAFHKDGKLRTRIFTISDGSKEIELPKRAEGREKEPFTAEEIFVEHPKPTGSYSNIGDTVIDVFDQCGSAKIAAVFLMTDGRVTGGANLDAAAAEAARRKTPIFTVGTGTQKAVADLSLDDLVAPPEANINDVMTLQVAITNTIRPSLKTELKLFEDDSKTPKVVRQLLLKEGETRIGVSIIPDKEGQRKYTLTLPQYPEELTYDNNEITCFVDVVKRKLKVLLIAGSPTMEFHHLVPSLIRDSVIDVSCFLQTADVNAVQQGNDVIDQLPRTTQEWNRYDVVVVYDIDPNKFTNDQETGLEWLVQNGGGVLFIAGRVNGMASLVQVRSAKIRNMLPVEINKNERPEHAQVFDQPFHIVRTPEGQKHPLLLFSMDTKQNDNVWQSFSELNFYWHHPVQGLSGKGIALMEKAREDQSSKRVPIMAMMRYGKGSSIYLGIHDIWRWRYPMESYDYDQFWSQTIRYLGEVRMLGSQRQVVLTTDKKMYSPGEQVEIRLSLLDPALVNQLRNDQIFAKVTDSEKGEYQVMLQPSVKDPTLRIGRYSARRIGPHEVRASHILAEDLAAQKAVFDEKKHFTVRMQSLEYKDTTADLDGLRNIAETTGGEALTHENITDLKNLPAKVSTEPDWLERETFGDLWDRLPILLVLLFFGTVELYFRRRWTLL